MSGALVVVGIGEDGLKGLSPAVRAIVERADVLAGGARHLALVPGFAGTTLAWPTGADGGIDAGLARLEKDLEAGKRIVILASGDPLDFGVGKMVVARFGPERVRVLPHPGSVSLACAALGWSRPDVQVVTIHGRPLESLRLYLVPGRRLVVLSQDAGSPAQLAKLLTEEGFGPSTLHVLERLGSPDERRITGRAESWSAPLGADLNIVGVELAADHTARPLTRLAGLPDEVYEHDGQLTKRFMRAITLSSLAPLPGETLWDLGAGAGSISIEWMRAHETCQAVAVERDPVRAARIRVNAAKLGVPRLKLIEGDSFEALSTLDGAPNAIFIGGNVAAPGLLHAAWARLALGGRLVANAVTEAGRDALKAFADDHGGVCCAVAVEGKAVITHYVGAKTKEDTP